MLIESLKDLEKLVKLMRKTGIDKIKVDGVELELNSLPYSGKYLPKTRQSFEEPTYTPGGVDANTPIHMDNIPSDGLTEEQLLMWSANGGQSLGAGETL